MRSTLSDAAMISLFSLTDSRGPWVYTRIQGNGKQCYPAFNEPAFMALEPGYCIDEGRFYNQPERAFDRRAGDNLTRRSMAMCTDEERREFILFYTTLMPLSRWRRLMHFGHRPRLTPRHEHRTSLPAPYGGRLSMNGRPGKIFFRSL